jgi:hypothetical protein
MPKYYITKYALSKGILYGECTGIPSGNYVSVKPFNQLFRIGVDAFESFDDARKRANDMRDKKMASLKKQMERLEKLKFDSPKKVHGNKISTKGYK